MTLAEAPTLSAALREGTRAAHEGAESSAFVAELVAGRRPLAAYTALAAQHLSIYRALEDAGERWRDDPVAGGFVRDELRRVPELERDLGTLLGPRGAERAAALAVPATVHYVQVITERAGTDPYAFVAHHYVRYLGDLSGGQIVRAALARHHGEAVRDALHFYTFVAIERLKPYRDAYRAALDALPLTATQLRATVDEARHAFALNRAVFAALDVAEP